MDNNKLTRWMKDFLIDEFNELLLNLEDNTPTSDFPAGLVSHIFEGHYADGSYTCNAYKSKQWVIEHFDEISDAIYDLRKFHYVELPDLWDSVEIFQLRLMHELSIIIVGESDTLNYSYETMNDLLKDLVKELEED